jgi:hypothetical protein
MAIGSERLAPSRGGLSRTMHTALMYPTIVVMLFLIFFVADATLLCLCFVRGLRLHRFNWPARTVQLFENRLGLLREHLDDWIDLQFVARRTRCVSALIYYPFIVLSLVLISRSSMFDDWHMPLSTLVLSVISVAIVLTCAMALRRMAEASRQHALHAVQDRLLRAKGQQGSAPLAAQLEILLKRIEELHEGAFAPFSQQPLLKALLLPFATYGGSALLDYMTLANL